MPPNLARLLYVVGSLLEYGRHLAATIERRSALPGFCQIASLFGTAKLRVILAHLHRGILRAIALEALLRKRAATGRDIVIRPPRIRTPSAARAGAPEAASDAPARRPAAGKAHDAPIDPDHLPTLAEIEAEVRRRSYGRNIAAISCDLGVVPGLCTRAFWQALTDAIVWYDGNTVARLKDMLDKQDRFFDELMADPALQQMFMDAPLGVYHVLGFKLGEPLAGLCRDAPRPAAPGQDVVAPEQHAAAPGDATGPPPPGTPRAA